MNAEQFLRTFVDGYLIEDLNSMAEIRRPGEPGSVGYPMLMALLAGCELLGRLLRHPRREGKEVEDFTHFWARYLFSDRDRKEAEEMGRAVYQLARNGIAHANVAKPGIYVTKHNDPRHLYWAPANGFVVDVLTLKDQFVAAYSSVRQRLSSSGGDAVDTLLVDEYNNRRAKSSIDVLARYQCPTDVIVFEKRDASTASPPTMINSPTIPTK